MSILASIELLDSYLLTGPQPVLHHHCTTRVCKESDLNTGTHPDVLLYYSIDNHSNKNDTYDLFMQNTIKFCIWRWPWKVLKMHSVNELSHLGLSTGTLYRFRMWVSPLIATAIERFCIQKLYSVSSAGKTCLNTHRAHAVKRCCSERFSATPQYSTNCRRAV